MGVIRRESREACKGRSKCIRQFVSGIECKNAFSITKEATAALQSSAAQYRQLAESTSFHCKKKK